MQKSRCATHTRAMLLACVAALPQIARAQTASTETAAPTAAPAPSPRTAGTAPESPPLQSQVGETSSQSTVVDIIVTAQRRSESAQKVPIAITALDSASLRERGLSNVSDLPSAVPNLQIKSQWGRSNPNFFMRGSGVSNFDETISQSVGVYLDENYLGSGAAQLAQFYDLERVEVLRGPQGTLFGRNTTAGAISIYTRRPGDNPNGYLQGSYGNYDYIQFEGGYTVALADNLRTRLSVFHETRDGWFQNLFRDTTDFDQRNLRSQRGNAINFSAIRLRTVYEGPGFDLDLTVYGSKDRSTPTNGKQFGLVVNPVTGVRSDALGFVDTPNWKEGFTNVLTSRNWVDVRGATLRANVPLSDAIDLTSITGYLYTSRFVHSDCDKSPADYCEFNRFGWTNQYSQELRLSKQGGMVEWVAGLYGFKEDVDQFSNAHLLFILAPPPRSFFNHRGEYRQKTLGGAAFGQLDWHFSDQLTLTLGGRYSRETKKFVTFTQLYDPATDRLTPFLGPVPDARTWGSPSWRVALRYQPTAQAQFFASVNRGFKAGGFPASNLSQSAEVSAPFNPETVTTYEAGTKLDLFGRRVRLNTSVFYSAFKDMQVFNFRTIPGTQNLISLTENAATAKVWGVEAELTAFIGDRLKLTANAAYLNARYDNYRYPDGTNFSGNPLINAPDWSGNVALEYRQPIGTAGDLLLRGDMTFASRRHFDQFKNPLLSEGPYQVYDASLTFNPASGRYSASAWIRNITDRAVIAESTDLSGIGRYYERFYNAPRTFGVTLRLPFD